MASKIIIPVFLIILLVFTSCLSRDTEAENSLNIFNATEDTIIVAIKYRSSYRLYHIIQPYECYRFGGNHTSSVFETIKERFEYLDKEIEIYKLACDTCSGIKINDQGGTQNEFNFHYIEIQPRIFWLPPLLYLPDSVHSFYNINSWVVKKGGRKNKWERATFTITKDDLKQSRQ
jgi:hypothetical protein